MRCWHSYLHYGLADATATPIISCFVKIQISLIFLVPAYPGFPGKEAVKWVSVCMDAIDCHYKYSIIITVNC